jgi:lipoprotein signal peptidase
MIGIPELSVSTGEVVDFLHVHLDFVPFSFPRRFWPVFNVAGAAICSRVFLPLITWRARVRLKESNAPYAV